MSGPPATDPTAAAPAGAAAGATPDQTAPAAAADDAHLAVRDPDLAIARIHLRLGSLGLARAELETLAGLDRLDDDAIRDLAETRWRTGDVAGAGEAAAAYLETRPDDIVALVIAAEAQSELGRPGEARRLAGRAMERANGSLDPIFAGMPRSPIWPVDPGAVVSAGVLFDDLHPGPLPTSGWLGTGGTASAAWADAGPHQPIDPAVPAAIVGGPSLWGEDETAGAEDALDPTTLFHAGRLALEHGDASAAATALILALRASPALAPAILDLLARRTEPILVLVRGDAGRLVGREAEAMRDHAAAASGLTLPGRTVGGPSPTAAEPPADAPPADAPAEPLPDSPAESSQEDS